MLKLLELLNQTSDIRIVFYAIVFVVVVGLIINSIVDIVKSLRKNK